MKRDHEPRPGAPAAPSRAAARAAALATAGIVALAALVRLREAARPPLGPDEIYIALLARLEPAAMLAAIRADVEQPLHFLVVWVWRRVAGEGDLALRLPFVAAGAAGVWASARLAAALFGPRRGALAALLLATQAVHIAASRTVGPDAFAWTFVTLAAWAAWAWTERRDRRALAGWTLAAAAALYTYWFSIVPLAAVAAWAAWRLRRGAGLAGWALGCAAAVALFAPQAPVLLEQLVRDARLAGAGARTGGLPPFGAAGLAEVARKLSASAPALVPLFASGAAAAFAARDDRRAASLAAAVALGAPLAMTALAHAGLRLFFENQAYVVTPFAAALVAAGVGGAAGRAARPGAAGRAWRAAGALACAALAVAQLRASLLRSPPAEAVALARATAWLAPRIAPGEPVFCAEPHAVLFLDWYLPGAARVRLLEVPEADAWHHSDAILAVPAAERADTAAWAAARAGGGRWWGIGNVHYPPYRTGREAAARMAAAAGAPVARFGRVTVWRGGVPPAASPADAP
uniref:Glycosyltransferase RgtA/B/C/D-like domain-containing protein n=1 Tax=Eiseniibacteriota bacterium TaxID=2212470 RepID=A0A832I7Q2_UNCEI